MILFYECDNAKDEIITSREIRYNTKLQRFTVFEFCDHKQLGDRRCARVVRASWAERTELPADLATQAETVAVYLDQNPQTATRKGVDWPLKGAQDVA